MKIRVTKKIITIVLALSLFINIVFVPMSSVRADDSMTTITVTASINRRSKADIIKRINEIRLEFYNLNQKYHYVDYTYTPVKWSSDMEEIAYIRAVESSVYWGHTRPNGESCFTVKSSSGQMSYSEVIAGNSDALDGVENWYTEKDDYIAQISGDTSNQAVTGHYAFLLYCSYVGIASYGVTVGEGSGTPGTSENQISPAGKRNETLSVKKSLVGLNMERYIATNRMLGWFTVDDNISITTGSTTQLRVLVNNYLTPVGTWKSSNSSVASVDSNGVVKAVGIGTATISFSSGGYSKSAIVTVSAASSDGGGSNNGSPKNEWINGKWYDKNGKQSYGPRGGWRRNSKGWWFEDSSGWYPHSQWQKIDGYWYYFTADGYMDYSEYRDGCWLRSDGSWDERYSSGTWHLDSKGWWYSDGNWYPASQSLWVDGTKYHFNSSGYWDY